MFGDIGCIDHILKNSYFRPSPDRLLIIERFNLSYTGKYAEFVLIVYS